MPDHQVIHLAVEPPASLTAELVAGAAGVLQREPCDTRLMLTGEVPKIIAHYQDVSEAETTAGKLRALGIQAMVVPGALLDSYGHILKACEMEIRLQSFLFKDEAGSEMKLNAGDIGLIIKGCLRESLERTDTRQKLRFNLAGTLLAGGIPIFRNVSEKTTARSVQAEYFIRLYPREPGSPVVDIYRELMNYVSWGKNCSLRPLSISICLQ